jgi:hypothetical protein
MVRALFFGSSSLTGTVTTTKADIDAVAAIPGRGAANPSTYVPALTVYSLAHSSAQAGDIHLRAAGVQPPVPVPRYAHAASQARPRRGGWVEYDHLERELDMVAM